MIGTELAAIIVAVITGGFGVLAEYARRRGIKRESTMEKELKFQASALDFSDYMREWSEINAEIVALFEESKIDRFLILRAWNGALDPRWTTAFFQLREEGQKAYSYTHVQLDRDYVDRLRHAVTTGVMVFSVADAPESLIKSVYDFEGVKHSAWFSIDTRRLDKSDSVALTYCSFATHHEEPISDAEMIRCRLIVSRIKNIAGSLNHVDGAAK